MTARWRHARPPATRHERFKIAIEEVRAAIRRAGLASFDEAQAVVLENDGNWSVVGKRRQSDLSAFEGLDVPEPL